MTIGEGTGAPPRPTNRIHWVNLSGTPEYADNPGCIGLDVGPADCPGDIDQNEVVDVDDLFIVINAWGPCDGPPPLPEDLGDPCAGLSPCPGDVSPAVCGDEVVDVDDLFTVINAWGDCAPSLMAGPSMPEWLEDCLEFCDGDAECLFECITNHEEE